MADSLLEKANEELQAKNDELQRENDKLQEQMKGMATQEELDALQQENTELREKVEGEDIEELRSLASQGKAYLDIVRGQAKDAYRAKLMSDGVKKTEIEEHPEYLSIVGDIEESTDIKQLYKMAQSYYRMARSNRAAGRVSAELNDYAKRVDTDKTHFLKGANDIR